MGKSAPTQSDTFVCQSPIAGLEGVNPAILAGWRRAVEEHTLHDPGPQWLSAQQLGLLWKLGRSQTLARLRRLGDRVVRTTRTMRRSDGHPVVVPVYRLKEAS